MAQKRKAMPAFDADAAAAKELAALEKELAMLQRQGNMLLEGTATGEESEYVKKKPRAEMTPEEKVADNKQRKDRQTIKDGGTPGKSSKGKGGGGGKGGAGGKGGGGGKGGWGGGGGGGTINVPGMGDMPMEFVEGLLGAMGLVPPGMSAGNNQWSDPNMKPGDWNCPGCNDLQFARNTECRKCGTANPSGGWGSGGGGKGGKSGGGKGKGGKSGGKDNAWRTDGTLEMKGKPGPMGEDSTIGHWKFTSKGTNHGKAWKWVVNETPEAHAARLARKAAAA